jgi:class 3 adenylate cyclase
MDFDKSGLYRAAVATVGGIKLKWREYPFQWEQDGRYSVVRIYDQGPIERFEGGIELEDLGANSTRVRVFSEMSARGAWGKTIIPLVANNFQKKTLDYCHKYLKGDNLNPAPRGPEPKNGVVNENLLDRLTSDLKKRPINADYAEALATYLKTAGDGEVAALRPYEWAREEGLEGEEALRTCFHAVKTGILNMRWSMMCPNCRVAKNESSSLSGVESQVHCDLCGVEYDLNFDRYIELKFAVHPVVRRANSDVFCLSGPFTAPHILVQKRIDPGQILTVPLLDSNQDLRLRVLRANKSVEVSSDAAPLTRLVYDGEGWNAVSTRGPFTIENSTDAAIFVALEKVEWDQYAVTAAHVTTLQEFRDLFSTEVLRPGRQVAIESVTLFFSDLSNSTALYESIGDGPAFGRVGSHFDFLTEHIGRNGGAVVKTMGDAVMAVFQAPEDAVRAALEIQSRFCEFRSSISEGDAVPLDLKIGLHHGPALVVNSNDRLDYFGRTVNVAARVASDAPRGHFVMTGDMWEFASVQRLLIEEQAELTRFESNLRGVEQAFALVRVRPTRKK